MMKKNYMYDSLILSLITFSSVLIAGIQDPIVCPIGEKNVWGENLRTGKIVDQLTVKAAQEMAYTRFINALASVGKDCFELGGRLEFGSMASRIGPQTPDPRFSATFAMNLGCCIRN